MVNAEKRQHTLQTALAEFAKIAEHNEQYANLLIAFRAQLSRAIETLAKTLPDNPSLETLETPCHTLLFELCGVLTRANTLPFAASAKILLAEPYQHITTIQLRDYLVHVLTTTTLNEAEIVTLARELMAIASVALAGLNQEEEPQILPEQMVLLDTIHETFTTASKYDFHNTVTDLLHSFSSEIYAFTDKQMIINKVIPKLNNALVDYLGIIYVLSSKKSELEFKLDAERIENLKMDLRGLLQVSLSNTEETLTAIDTPSKAQKSQVLRKIKNLEKILSKNSTLSEYGKALPISGDLDAGQIAIAIGACNIILSFHRAIRREFYEDLPEDETNLITTYREDLEKLIESLEYSLKSLSEYQRNVSLSHEELDKVLTEAIQSLHRNSSEEYAIFLKEIVIGISSSSIKSFSPALLASIDNVLFLEQDMDCPPFKSTLLAAAEKEYQRLCALGDTFEGFIARHQPIEKEALTNRETLYAFLSILASFNATERGITNLQFAAERDPDLSKAMQDICRSRDEHIFSWFISSRSFYGKFATKLRHFSDEALTEYEKAPSRLIYRVLDHYSDMVSETSNNKRLCSPYASPSREAHRGLASIYTTGEETEGATGYKGAKYFAHTATLAWLYPTEVGKLLFETENFEQEASCQQLLSTTLSFSGI